MNLLPLEQQALRRMAVLVLILFLIASVALGVWQALALQVLVLQVRNHPLHHRRPVQQIDLKLSSEAHSEWVVQLDDRALTRLSVLFIRLAWIQLVSKFELAQML
jgi:hypothetical protein